MSIKIYIRIYIYNTFTEKSKKTIKIARFTQMFHVKNKAHFKPFHNAYLPSMFFCFLTYTDQVYPLHIFYICYILQTYGINTRKVYLKK